jgi:hypothetical protein
LECGKDVVKKGDTSFPKYGNLEIAEENWDNELKSVSSG